MGLDEASAREQVNDGSRRWALVFALLGVAAVVAPFVVGPGTTGWIVVGVGAGLICGVAALAAASDGDLDGPPPRRTG